MDGSTASKVETAQLVYPTVGVPCPAGNRVINDCGPDKDEDHARKHATTFSGCTNCECRGDSREHTLEDRKKEIGDVSTLLSEDSLETEVV